ncbi:nucleotide pyrophosphohydrolase [candidate division KSB1 bacterium]|nr:nucleotide pyrophosphohydrolase [candidate division KSB1 bacterium]
MDFEKLKKQLQEFADRRDWNQFHSPKNLSMALISEAGELIEHFQWLTEEQSQSLDKEELEQVAQEIADVQIYLVRLADMLNIDLEKAVQQKIKINEEKYPHHKVKGSSKKYTQYK